MTKPLRMSKDQACEIEAEAEGMMLDLISEIKLLGYDVRGFGNLNENLKPTKLHGTPVHRVVATHDPYVDGELTLEPVFDFVFYTAYSVPLGVNCFGSSTGTGHITFDAMKAAHMTLSGPGAEPMTSIEIVDYLRSATGKWPLSWKVRVFKGSSEVYFELQTRPYLLRDLSSLVRNELISLAPNVCPPITVRRSFLTDRTSANRTLREAITAKMNFFTPSTFNRGSSIAELENVLQNVFNAICRARDNWEHFKTAIRQMPDLTCVTCSNARDLCFEAIARTSTEKPDNQLIFVTNGSTGFTVFYDLMTGHSSVFLPSPLLDIGGLTHARHMISHLVERLEAKNKKPRYRKQTVLIDGDIHAKKDTASDADDRDYQDNARS